MLIGDGGIGGATFARTFSVEILSISTVALRKIIVPFFSFLFRVKGATGIYDGALLGGFIELLTR
jgi:hypothetical protein